MSENDLIVHQRALQEARLRANEVTPDTRTRLRINETNRTPIIRRSAPTEASQRQTLTVVSGSRTERSISTRREREQLGGIKADAEGWINRALSSSGGFNLREAKIAYDLLNSAFCDI